MAIELEHGSATHIGKTRRENQDFMGANGVKRVFWVADGIGGHTGGKEAAWKAVQTAHGYFDPKRPESLVEALHEAHQRILRVQKRTGSNMGTTLTGLHIDQKGKAYIAHVGDSRIYRLSQGELKQLTPDHTIAVEYPEVDTPELAHAVTRAIGNKKKLKPFTNSLPTGENDIYLLCSDGVHGQVKDEKIKEVLVQCAAGNLKLREAAKQLTELANDAGGKDNATAVVVRVKHVKE